MIKKIVAVFLLLFLASVSLSSAQEYKNIGFKKDVSRELRQKFPMCEEFLDVKWIDAKRYIGKLKADYYRDNKNQGVSYFLVKAEGYSGMATDGYFFYTSNEQQYNSKEFDEFIQQAKFYFGQGILTAVKEKKKEKFVELVMPFHSWVSTSSPKSSTESFAYYTKNICLLDPEEKTAVWIEDKKPFQDENLRGELKEKYENILKMATENCNKEIKSEEIVQKCMDIDRGKYKDKCNKPETYICNMKPVKYGESIDLNFDGIEEYMSRYVIDIDTGGGKKRILTGKGFIIFSKNGKLELINLCGPFYFKESERAFYSGNCNLTELTKGGK